MRLSPVVQSLTEPLLSPLVSAITGASGSGFSPRSLFADGAKGVVYDNNDFVDSATWRRNLLTYSEQFDNAAWSKSSSSITANSTIAPDGTSTADTWTPTSSGATGTVRLLFTATTAIGSAFTASIYVKPNGKRWLYMTTPAATSALHNCWFDLQNGVAGTIGSAATSASITAVGSGWYRVSVTSPVTVPTNYIFISATDADNSTTVTSDGNSIFVWGAQLERASSASDYQRITDFNSDFLAAFPRTTLFLDSAGTTAATVNGLVGLQLDKSANLALGAEISPNNGTFSSAVGWTTGAGTSIGSGVCTSTAVTPGTLMVSPTGTTTIGKWYLVTLVVDSITAGAMRPVLAGNVLTTALISAAGTYTYRVLASDTSVYFQAFGSNTSSVISSFSVREITGNHRYQSTTGSKPVLRGTPTGANLVTNGDFASDVSGWADFEGGVSTWSAGSIVVTNGTATTGNSRQSIATTSGKTYLLSLTCTALSGVATTFARVGSTSGGGEIINAIALTAGQTYNAYFTATSSTTHLRIGPNSATIGHSASFDNITLRDVSAGQVTAPYGLQYDGVDDFLQTAAVDFTATDKMFVCAGVRALASASSAIFVESSVNVGSNAGSFYISMPESANNIGHRFRGSLAGGTGSVSGYTAPYTRVISLIGDIAGDVNTLRANGAEISTSAVDQGTGTLGNYAIYFGRRAGTSLPYNGLDFGMVICGKTLTSTQIANTERWMSYRTGVTL